LSAAAVKAGEILGIPNAALARILGVSEATASRLRQGNYRLRKGRKEFELAAFFVRLFRGLDAITGGDDVASRSWFGAENTALRGRPVDLVQTVGGLVNIVAYLDSRRARL